MRAILVFFAFKIGYFLLAAGLLVLIRRFFPKPKSPYYLERRFRFMIGYRYLNGLVLIIYAWLVAAGPFATVLWPKFGYFQALLLDDSVNFSLIIAYILFFLGQNYAIDRKIRFIRESYLSYIAGFGFFWLLIVILMMFFRFDYYYLPLWSERLSPFWQNIVEIASVVLFFGFQLLVLGIRKLKMIEAPYELKSLVNEVAAQFGLKIRNVRVWKLEKVTNAFATGIFFKSVFVTENLLQAASTDDLKMIIGHECAHFARHHLIIRTLLLGGMIFAASYFLDSFPDLSWPFYAGLGILGIVIFKMISRAQEFEADRVAATKLGGGSKMVEALNKVFGMAAIPSRFGIFLRWLIGHPDPESRIRKLTKI